MRNTLILALLCFSFASCEKEYICECTTGAASDTAFQSSFRVNVVKEAQAKDRCVSHQEKLNTNQQLGVNCTIK